VFYLTDSHQVLRSVFAAKPQDYYLIGLPGMVGNDSNSKLPRTGEGRKGKSIRGGVALILAGIVLFGTTSYYFSQRSRLKQKVENPAVANLNDVSLQTPSVLRAPANSENGVKTGESLQATKAPSLREKISSTPESVDYRPFLELSQIIPFGMSLELVGRVEPGSRLMANDEAVEIAGDGSYKHFTNPFPASSQKVKIVMKATDLAGRSSVLTAIHDFRVGDGKD